MASSRWPDAAVAGLACSMRSTSTPAVLAARGRIGGTARALTFVAAAGEIAADKTPLVPSRTAPPSLAGRIAVGGFCGRLLAGPAGLVAGAVAAAVGTFAAVRLRGLVVDVSGWPDPVVAIGEDVLALTLAAVATRDET